MPPSEMLVLGTVAVSKFVGCDFSRMFLLFTMILSTKLSSEMGYFEAQICMFMYKTILPTEVSPAVKEVSL